MRTIAALIAATFCALALSGSTLARDSFTPTANPGWLEFRAALAAEDLWPKKVGVRKTDLVKAQMDKRKDADGPVAAEHSALEVQRVLDAFANGERQPMRCSKTSTLAGN